MALTIDFLDDYPSLFGPKRVIVATATFDSSYSTGGEALLASTLGLKTVEFMSVENNNIVGPTISFWWDRSNEKLVALWSGLVTSTSTISSSGNEVPGTGLQVPNGTDLSTASVRIFAIGT